MRFPPKIRDHILIFGYPGNLREVMGLVMPLHLIHQILRSMSYPKNLSGLRGAMSMRPGSREEQKNVRRLLVLVQAPVLGVSQLLLIITLLGYHGNVSRLPRVYECSLTVHHSQSNVSPIAATDGTINGDSGRAAGGPTRAIRATIAPKLLGWLMND